jgi:hypothetical protein
LESIKKFLYNRKKEKVHREYKLACYELGCAESYWFAGKAIGIELMRDSLAYWTKQARKFKIRIATEKERYEFGGYGKDYEGIVEYGDYGIQSGREIR